MTPFAQLLKDTRVVQILGTIGVRYWWNRGTPSTPWAKVYDGVDCSGFLQMCLVLLGLLPSSAKDRRAIDLANASDAVKLEDVRLGDFAYYPGHVMLCLCGPWVIGATGGDSTTHGDKDTACVQLKRYDYRKDFVTFCRLKT